MMFLSDAVEILGLTSPIFRSEKMRVAYLETNYAYLTTFKLGGGHLNSKITMALMRFENFIYYCLKPALCYNMLI